MEKNEWVRLLATSEQRFRLQHATLLEYARATLPTHLSRRVVFEGIADPSAMPAEMWQRGDEFALVWYVRHPQASAGSAPHRVVGFLQEAVGQPIRHIEVEPPALPLALRAADLVRYAERFWSSDTLRDSSDRTQVGTDSKKEQAPAGRDDTPAMQATIRDALGKIDDAFRSEVSKKLHRPLPSFALKPTGTPDDAVRWTLQDDHRERQDVATLLRRAGVCNFQLELDATERMVLLQRQVPFYAGCTLYRVIDMRGPRSRFASFVIHRESADLLSLYTQSEPIHAYNQRRMERGELHITESTVGAYLRFFCEFVHGPRGAFSVIESANELRWLSQTDNSKGASSSRDQRELITKTISEVSLYIPRFDDAVPPPQLPVNGAGDDDAIQAGSVATAPIYCRCFVGYDRHVFAAGFEVSQGGMPNMFADAPLHEAELRIEPLSYNVEFQFRLRVDEEDAHDLGDA